MGCVFGREVKQSSVQKGRERRERKEEEEEEEENEVRVERVVDVGFGVGVGVVEVVQAQNGGNRKEKEDERGVKSRKRSSKPNPRLSNPPRHLHGEQVAAGWPSWLSAVAGEAINGWTPRRADTFEKLDKASCLCF
jgi:cyclin-dependent kinase 12/13